MARLSFFGREARHSIGSTILIAFLAMCLIVGALGTHGLWVLSAASRFVSDTYDRSLMAVSYARSASLDFSRMQFDLLLSSGASPGERAAIAANLHKLMLSFREDLDVVERRSMTSDEQRAIQQLRGLADHWEKLRDAGPESAVERDVVGARIMDRLDMLIELTTDHGFVARRRAMSSMREFTYSSVAAIALALLISGTITLLLTRRIMRPLSAAAAVADRIAQGELETPIPPGGADETGKLLRSMTVMQDNIRQMVERETAQRRSAQNRLADALESSPEAIVLVDAEGRIVIANSQLARFFPTIAPKLALGMSFAEASRYLHELVARTTSSDTDLGEKHVLLSAGSEFQVPGGRWLRVSRSATKEGDFFLLISDISESKEREQRLDEARREAEAASDAKGSFLATMSHELRTPLNAVIGFSEILAGQLFGKLGNPKYVEYVESIRHSATHLLGIINNVLDLSKHQAGKLIVDREAFDIAEIIKTCASIMRDQCERAELRLETRASGELIICGDAGRLKQTLLNLISNAVKFTPAGGTVTISAEATENGFVRLQVADSGIGMAPEQIPVALAVFGQIDSRLARRYEGTGLGLPLAKSLIELHGGTLSIDSEPGHGTTVTVLLPCVTDVPETASAAAPLVRVA